MLIQKILTQNKTEFMEPAPEKTKYSKELALRILPGNINHVNTAKSSTQVWFFLFGVCVIFGWVFCLFCF